MTSCAVVDCINSTRNGSKMKRFPSDPERKKVWVEKVNRENWSPNIWSRLCEAHFAPDMFEQHRADGLRKLKWNAIPTIFPNIEDDIYSPVLKSSDKNTNEPLTKKIKIESEEYPSVSDSLIKIKCEPEEDISVSDSVRKIKYELEEDLSVSDSSIKIKCESKEDLAIDFQMGFTFDPNSATVWSVKEDIQTSYSSSASNEPLLKTYRELKNRVMLYNRVYSKLLKRNNVLEAKLREMQQPLHHVKDNIFFKCLKKVFTNNQIYAVLKKNNQGFVHQWDNETIQKALKTKLACGSRGYEELIRQNFPLPSQRTLRRKVQQINSQSSNRDAKKFANFLKSIKRRKSNKPLVLNEDQTLTEFNLSNAELNALYCLKGYIVSSKKKNLCLKLV